MRPFYLILLALLIISIPAIGQNAKGDRVEMGYLRLPAAPLEGNFDTYSVSIIDNAADLPDYDIDLQEIEETNFQFNKYKKVDKGGDFKVVAQISKLGRYSIDLEKEEETQGSGDNAKTVKVFYYYINWAVPMTYQLKDGSRKIMVEQNADYYHGVKFGPYNNVGALVKAWRAERGALLAEERRESIVKAFRSLSNRLYSDIDERVIKTKYDVFYIKKAKKYGLEDFDKALELAKAKMPSSASKGMTDDVKSNMSNAVSIWEKAVGKYDVTNKKEVNIAFVAAMNLATYYAMAGDYGKATEHINTAITAKTKKMRVADMRRLIADLENRQFMNDNVGNSFTGKFDNSAADEDDFIGGAYAAGTDFVMAEGKKSVGDVVVRRAKNGSAKKVFVYPVGADDDAEPTIVKVDEVSKMSVRGIEYIPVAVPNLENPLAKNVYFCNMVAESRDKVALLQLRSAPEEYLFVVGGQGKKGKTKVYLTDGIKLMNINKGLAGLFPDCGIITDKAAQKKYMRNALSYKSVITDYDSCK